MDSCCRTGCLCCRLLVAHPKEVLLVHGSLDGLVVVLVLGVLYLVVHPYLEVALCLVDLPCLEVVLVPEVLLALVDPILVVLLEVLDLVVLVLEALVLEVLCLVVVPIHLVSKPWMDFSVPKLQISEQPQAHHLQRCLLKYLDPSGGL